MEESEDDKEDAESLMNEWDDESTDEDRVYIDGDDVTLS